jgi:Carbohydrate-binding domain-containing protein Cthe_2159
VVTGGTLDVTAGGDALKADNAGNPALGYVAITGGALDLTAGTDAIDATTTAIVDNGSLVISAGDDALHADVRLEINGGTIDIDRSYEGLEATQIVITGLGYRPVRLSKFCTCLAALRPELPSNRWIRVLRQPWSWTDSRATRAAPITDRSWSLAG